MAIYSSPTLTFLPLLLLLLSAASSAFPGRALCQYPTRNPLIGCPPHTLLVGPTAPYTSIQSAILSLPNDTTPYTLLIQPGTYTEQLNITRPGPVYLLGVTRSPNSQAQNSVRVLWHQATGTAATGTLDNAYTAVLTVAPTLNASLTGAGPTGWAIPAGTPYGNADFRAYNVDFANEYAEQAAGPSLAVSVSYANAGFYFCRVESYQDTVYIGKLGNAYMHSSTIAGQTDFLYGFGTLWIQSSLLSLRSCGGGITAWKGTNTTFANKYGVYIHDSAVRAANASLNIAHKCSLGRPWNDLHRSIFVECDLDDSILPAGYTAWGSTDPRVDQGTFMAEYRDFGPGWNRTARLEGNITIVLDERGYEPYDSVEKVFTVPMGEGVGEPGYTFWIDRSPAAA